MPTNPPVGRYALLVAVGAYDDPSLDQLRAPEQDVERLAAVLEDPAVGNFTVRTLADPADHEVRREIEDLLTDRVNDDLVLLYFSCHGIVDPFHRLYFAAANTVRTRPASTAISRSFVNEQLEACRAAAKVLVLDCCFAGAFAEGFKGHPQGALDGQIGRGYVVISACDSYEYAFESDGLVESAPRGSIFTDVLLEGLATGGADLDGDGRIGVDELFRYVHDGVVRRRPDQKPKWSAYNAEPHIYLATVPTTAASAGGPGGRGGVAKAGAGATARPTTYNRHQAIVARGFRAGADLVRRTFGPLGRRVLVEDAAGAYHELGDAAGVVRLFTAYDTRDAIGAGYVRELVEGVRHRVGDGATTTVVLAQAMMDGASTALRAGANPVALCRGIETATRAVLTELADLAVPVETKEQLRMVSTIASDDELVGDLLASAMERVGKDGVVIVEESNLFGLELELTEGMRLPAGHVSPYFVTDPEGAEAVLADPAILIVDQRLASGTELQPLLDAADGQGRPLAVFAQDVRDGALTALIVGKARHARSSVAVRLGGPDHERRSLMADLALLTGATVVGAADGGLGAARPTVLGGARKVITTRRDSTVVDGAGDPELIRRRVRQLRAALAQPEPGPGAPVEVTGPGVPVEVTGSGVREAVAGSGVREAVAGSGVREAVTGADRAAQRAQLARLAGGVAVIRVGESADGQLKKRKRQIDDAVRNARAAVEWGIVPGGGAALLTVANRISTRVPRGDDEALGYAVVVDALVAPYEELLRNAGRDPLAGPADLRRRGPGVTFDVVSGTYVTALDAGIVDAVATLRQAVTAAAGVVTRYLMIG